jgi:hypothetical protein
MSTASERRRYKALAKKKKNRSKAGRARDARRAHGVASPAKAARWPVTEALISETWHEWGVELHGALVRQHDDGTVAALFVTVDLEARGVVSAECEVGIHQATVEERFAELSEPTALMSTDPAHIAQLVRFGARFGQRNGHEQPAGLAAVDALLGALDATTSPYDINFGTEGEDEDTEEFTPPPPPVEPWFGRVKSWFDRA